MKEGLEKLHRVMPGLSAYMLFSGERVIASGGIEKPESLKFKLSVIEELHGIEEMVVERREGCSYLRVYGDTAVYLEFSTRPCLSLLKLYLRWIAEGVAQQAERESTRFDELLYSGEHAAR